MTEIEQLRQEVAALRREIAEIRADRVVHHYHHQAAPAPFVLHEPLSPTVKPMYPGGPYPATCGGTALGGVGLASQCRNEAAWGEGIRVLEIEGGTDWSKTSGPNAP